MAAPEKDVDVETEVKVANALCAAFAKVAPGAPDYEKIEHVVRALIANAQEQVRVATAKALRHRSSLPRDMALSIAKDTDLVSSPFLEVTTSLSDDDLTDIVRSSNSIAKMMSIARRSTISEGLSDALIENGSEQVVASVVSNSGAAIAAKSYNTALDRFPGTEAIQAAMIDRAAVPSQIMARLHTTVSELLRQRLIARHGLSESIADAIATEARERAAVGLGFGLNTSQLHSLIGTLADQGALTGSFLARALCAGNVQLFEHGLAAAAKLAIPEVRKLFDPKAKKEFAGVWSKAGFDDKFMPLLVTTFDVIRQTDAEAEKWDIQTYRATILQRTLTLDQTIDSVLSPDEIESLIDTEEQLRASLKSGDASIHAA